MKHPSDEELSAVLENEPAPGVAEHVDECRQCQVILEQLRLLRAAANSLEPIEPPASLDVAVRRAVSRVPSRHPGWLRWAWAPAAAAVLVVVGLLIGRWEKPESVRTAARPAVSAGQAELVAADIEAYLAGLDQAVEECARALAENPGNDRVRAAWAAARTSRSEAYDRFVSLGD